MAEKRLDSIIRGRGAASKREVRTLAEQGRISVNGKRAESAYIRCDEKAKIEIDGRPVPEREPVTLMMNKPSGYVCTNEKTEYPSVLSLLAGEEYKSSVFAIGRLDADTEGLLLLSNDGELCSRAARPEQNVRKRYYVTFDRPLHQNAKEMLLEGAVLANGERCRPALLETVGEREAFITVSEGKYHEVKRLIRACGARVSTLRRVAIGALQLDETLPAGGYRRIDSEEIALIFQNTEKTKENLDSIQSKTET